MKIKTVLCAMLLALYSAVATADTWSYRDFEFTTTSENTVAVSGYTGSGVAVAIPDKVTKDAKSYTVTAIGASAFYKCTSLTFVDIPNSVTTIGESAFYKCTSLTFVDIPNSVTTIGVSAFRGCNSLASVTIPNSVTTIGAGAFDGCSSLASVTIPNSVTTIGESAFSECTSLTSVDIPNSVTTIGAGAFWGCSSLASVTIPSSVTTIEEWTFYFCVSLMSVDIPSSVTTIGRYAFENCSRLTSVTIPGSVTTIGKEAFADCSSLVDVYVNWATPLSVPSDIFAGVTVSYCTLHVPAGTGALYKAAPVWKEFYIPGYESLLTVSPATVDIASSGGTASITVTSNVSWTASSYGWWITVSPSSGTNDGTVTVTATENTGASRTAIVTISSSRITRMVSVTQAGANGNASIELSEEILYYDGVLSIRTPVSEPVTVYSLSGVPVFTAEKEAGLATFRLNRLPGGIYIVRGNNWVRKILIQKM